MSIIRARRVVYIALRVIIRRLRPLLQWNTDQPFELHSHTNLTSDSGTYVLDVGGSSMLLGFLLLTLGSGHEYESLKSGDTHS